MLHPAPLPEPELRGIVERAEGNAFFTEELVAAAELGAGRCPTDLADLLLVRLDQLDDAARLVVRAASVGRSPGPARAAGRASSTSTSDRSTRALRAAVERNVLVPVGADGYAFRHALLAEAVYDDLLPGERVRLHARLRRRAAQPATCRHRGRAGPACPGRARPRSTAARASIQAGDEAMAVGRPRRGRAPLRGRARAAADPTGTPSRLLDVVDLTVKASTAATTAGHVPARSRWSRTSSTRCPPTPPADARARLLVALASPACSATAASTSSRVTTEALHLVPASSRPRCARRVLNMHARANADRAAIDEAARWAEAALRSRGAGPARRR